MSVYHVYTHVYTHDYPHVCTHVHTHIHTHAHTHAHTHVCTHVHTHVCTHAHTHVCTHAHTRRTLQSVDSNVRDADIIVDVVVRVQQRLPKITEYHTSAAAARLLSTILLMFW